MWIEPLHSANKKTGFADPFFLPALNPHRVRSHSRLRYMTPASDWASRLEPSGYLKKVQRFLSQFLGRYWLHVTPSTESCQFPDDYRWDWARGYYGQIVYNLNSRSATTTSSSLLAVESVVWASQATTPHSSWSFRHELQNRSVTKYKLELVLLVLLVVVRYYSSFSRLLKSYISFNDHEQPWSLWPAIDIFSFSYPCNRSG